MTTIIIIIQVHILAFQQFSHTGLGTGYREHHVMEHATTVGHARTEILSEDVILKFHKTKYPIFSFDTTIFKSATLKKTIIQL